jgi:2-polyprenyl-3-methyl-5-hydroxy-6-metoxy-1,4-benzoquinol methylase
VKRLAIRSREEERMDDPSLDPAVYAAVVGDLSKVNALLMVSRPTIAFIRRTLGTRKRFRLLDVGYGQGDMLRAIARWAARRGIEAELVGVDLNPRSLPAARAATPDTMRIDYRTGDYADTAGEPWDYVISSSVTHHMTDEQLHAFLRFMEGRARIGWYVNDIHRHWLAYLGFPPLAWAMRWHSMVRHDGCLSVQRGFRTAEWERLIAGAGIDPAGPRVVRRFPMRLCVERAR